MLSEIFTSKWEEYELAIYYFGNLNKPGLFRRYQETTLYWRVVIEVDQLWNIL